MERCVECLIRNGYKLVEWEDDLHVLLTKIIDTNEFIVLLIGPHNGNNYQYILRGDFLDYHDRWSNCSYQRYFNDEDDFERNWNRFWWYDEDEQ